MSGGARRGTVAPPSPLLERGIAVARPDSILAPGLDEQLELIRTILGRQANAWGDCSLPHLTGALERAGVRVFSRNAHVMLDA